MRVQRSSIDRTPGCQRIVGEAYSVGDLDITTFVRWHNLPLQISYQPLFITVQEVIVPCKGRTRIGIRLYFGASPSSRIIAAVLTPALVKRPTGLCNCEWRAINGPVQGPIAKNDTLELAPEDR